MSVKNIFKKYKFLGKYTLLNKYLPIMVIAQELWEVVEQYEKYAQGAAVKFLYGLCQLRVAQERGQELEQRRQQLNREYCDW